MVEIQYKIQSYMSRYEQMKIKFRDNIQFFRKGPRQNRQIRDKGCYAIFIINILVLIILGLYVIIEQSDRFKTIENSKINDSSSILTITIKKYYQIIGVMFSISIIVSFIYLILLRFQTKCMVYLLIILILCLLMAILIFALIQKNTSLIILMVIAIVVFCILIWCFRDHLQKGIQILRIAVKFISEKPSVYFSTIWVFIISILFFIFWIVSVMSVQTKANYNKEINNNSQQPYGIFGYFIYSYIFMTIFFYYVLTFLIATACSVWYYGLQDGYFCNGVGRINRYHIGSLTFAANVITFLKMIQIFVLQKNNSDNTCTKYIKCCLACILNKVQYILKVLNNFAIISMSVTGQSYIQSAQTAAYTIFQSIGLFSATNMIGSLILFGGIIFSVSIPSLLGLIYCKVNYNPTSDQLDNLGLILLFGTIIIVTFLIGTLTQALSCVLFFYYFDKRMNENGCLISYPQTLNIFKQHQDDQIPNSSSKDLEQKDH